MVRDGAVIIRGPAPAAVESVDAVVDPRGWLEIERQRAWVAGDEVRAARCSAALNGDGVEIEALLNERPASDGDGDDTAGVKPR